MGIKDTYNPYPEEDRKKIPSVAWIFTERLKFTNGLSNNVPSEWEKHLAEISFKAGEQKQLIDGIPYDADALEGARYAGCYSGLRKVMVWVREHQLPDTPNSEPYRGLVVISKVQLEAKLKELGIVLDSEMKEVK